MIELDKRLYMSKTNEDGTTNVQHIVKEGEYSGFKWFITTVLSHPCAYIVMDEDLFIELREKLDETVHGGVSYHAKDHWINKELFLVGWAYAHYGDYQLRDESLCRWNTPESKGYTVEQLEKDIQEAIDLVIAEHKPFVTPSENFEESNFILGPPKGMTEEDCSSLPVCANDQGFLSCWELTDGQIELLKKTKKIYLQLHTYNHPMVSLWVFNPVGTEYKPLERGESKE